MTFFKKNIDKDDVISCVDILPLLSNLIELRCPLLNKLFLNY